MDQKYVFISYKADEFDRVLPLKKHLEANGIPCWMAPMSIRGGLSYAQEIPPAIQGCGVFLLYLTKKAQESKWVPREVDQAINSEKVVMPFMPEPCALRDDFSFYLTNVQRYEAFRAPEETLDQMTRDIQKILGIEPIEEEEAPEEKTPVQKPKPPKKKKVVRVGGKKKVLPWILGGALALLVLLILLLLPGRIVLGGVSCYASDTSVVLEEVELGQGDLKKLSKFKNLYSLRLKNCTLTVQDLSGMNLSELVTLQLKNCGLTDEQFATLDFSAMPDLLTVDVSENGELTKVDGLATLAESLTDLNISDTGIREFQWLSKFVKLESLYANRVGLNDTALLEGMIYLRWLGLGGNGISDLSGLKNTSKLEEVDLSGNKLSDVSVLSRSVAVLRVVHLESNALSDLTPLSEAMNLEEVYVDENGLQDLKFLKGHEKLRVLSASKNQIDSLYGLSLGAKLRYMNLADNKLRSVGAGELVFGKDEYVVLDLGGNDLEKLSLPTECTYKMLNLLGNSRLPLTELAGVQGWDLYLECSETATLENLKALGFTKLSIVGCPLDRRVELEEGLLTERLITAEEAQAEIVEVTSRELQ